jgi:hypothetical protein
MVLDPEKIQIELFFIPWVTLQGIRIDDKVNIW